MSEIYNHNASAHISLVYLKVKANSKVNYIDYFIEIEGKQYLKISIKAVAEDNKANIAIIDFLSKKWKIPKVSLEIIRGHSNHLKTIAIKNIEVGYLNSILTPYIKT